MFHAGSWHKKSTEQITGFVSGETVNKTEMISAVAAARNTTKVEATQLVEMFFDPETGIIAKELQAGGEVKIQGFGVFGVTSRKERDGINPKSGAPLKIAASNTPKFKAGSTLRASLNK